MLRTLFGVRVCLRAWPKNAAEFEKTPGSVEYRECFIRRRTIPAVGETLHHPDLRLIAGHQVARVSHHWGRHRTHDVTIDVFVGPGILSTLNNSEYGDMHQEKWFLRLRGPAN